jgi:predicted RNA-binding protein YlxR (DUF448 family)
MIEKKSPSRKCIGCNTMADKKELIRVVRYTEVSLDVTGKKPGRGAYIHRQAECIKKARKKNSFSRALKCSVTDEIYDLLNTEINKCVL